MSAFPERACLAQVKDDDMSASEKTMKEPASSESRGGFVSKVAIATT